MFVRSAKDEARTPPLASNAGEYTGPSGAFRRPSWHFYVDPAAPGKDNETYRN